MPRIAATVVTAAGLAFFVAGCGGGGGSPGIASLAGDATTTTTQADSGPPADTPPGGSAPNGFRLAMKVGTGAAGEKFSACMRTHGVPNYPDPNGQGLIIIQSGMGIDPGSPAFRSARTTCQKLLPNGGQPTPAQIAKQQQQLLAFSVCMRAHGIKDFPDPSNGGLSVVIHAGGDLGPDVPAFQRAQQACQKYMPFKGG